MDLKAKSILKLKDPLNKHIGLSSKEIAQQLVGI